MTLRLVGLLAAIVYISDGQLVSKSSLNSLRFLSGRWVSETPSEVQEEVWSPASGESMVGSFRIVQHGRAVFYEFWAIEVENRRPVLKLKHFNAGLSGWEEKNASTELPLVSGGENDAVFSQLDGKVSLHYHRAGDKLTCIVQHVKNGKASDETFVLYRSPDVPGTRQ